MVHGQDGAEALAQLIKEVFDPLIQSVFEQDGFVTNLAGDAFTAVFPADDETVQAYMRTLAAAWRIQQVMAEAQQHQTPYGTFAVSVKVGVAAGEVTWGIASSADQHRAAYYFQGAAVDNCVVVEKLAQDGDVIMHAAMYDTLRSMISAEAREDHFRINAINGALPRPHAFQLRPVDAEIARRFFPLKPCSKRTAESFDRW